MRLFKGLTLAAGTLAGIVGLASAGQNAMAFTVGAPDGASASLLHSVAEARKYNDSNDGFYNGGGYAPGGYYTTERPFMAPYGGGFNDDDDSSYDPAATAYGPSYRTNGGTRPYAGGYDFDNYPPGSAGAEQLRQRRFEYCESSPSRC